MAGTSEQSAALARHIYEAFNRDDLHAAADVATDDMEVELVPFGQTFRGREGLLQCMGVFKTAFPDLQITVTNQVATDDQVVSECSWHGTHTGVLKSPLRDIASANKAVVGGRFCEVLRIRDGKVARLANYQDAASWLRQLGLVP